MINTITIRLANKIFDLTEIDRRLKTNGPRNERLQEAREEHIREIQKLIKLKKAALDPNGASEAPHGV